MPRYLTGNDRERERLTQHQTIQRFSKRFAADFRSEIESVMKEAANQYRQEGTDLVLPSIIEGHTAAMETLISRAFQPAAKSGGRRVLDEVKSIHGRLWVKEEETGKEEAFLTAMMEGLRTRALIRSTGIAKTTEAAIKATIQAGLERDEGVDAIAANIEARAPVLSSARAAIIARTESHSAYNFGHKKAADLSDLQLDREWVSAMDERTREGRFDHRDADGEVAEGGVFVQTGEKLEHPGDYSGSPGNIIACRCGMSEIVR